MSIGLRIVSRRAIFFGGGALGGIIGNLLPLLFPRAMNTSLLLIITVVLLCGTTRCTEMAGKSSYGSVRRACSYGCYRSSPYFICSAALHIVDVRRNVYGSLHILHQDIDGRPRLEMRHGHTNHGQAYLDQTRAQPITYYYHGRAS